MVIVVAGKSKGVKGKVLSVNPKTNKVIVEGANIQTKHQKPKGPQNPGGIIKKEGPIDISNVMLFCPPANKGVRFSVKEVNGKKIRYNKKYNYEFDK